LPASGGVLVRRTPVPNSAAAFRAGPVGMANGTETLKSFWTPLEWNDALANRKYCSPKSEMAERSNASVIGVGLA
jgi:hypothetical protein